MAWDTLYFISSLLSLFVVAFSRWASTRKGKSANWGNRCLFCISSNAKKSRKGRIRKNGFKKIWSVLIKCKVRVRKWGRGFKIFGSRKGVGGFMIKRCMYLALFFCVVVCFLRSVRISKVCRFALLFSFIGVWMVTGKTS